MPEPMPEPGILPDDLPKRGLFQEPLSVGSVEVLDPEPMESGRFRVTFRIQVRDARGRPCPDLAVDGRIEGPERVGEGTTRTDLFGRARFRLTGPRGRYRFTLLDVAAGGLELVTGAGDAVAVAETTVA